jgi:hypothetical protein
MFYLCLQQAFGIYSDRVWAFEPTCKRLVWRCLFDQRDFGILEFISIPPTSRCVCTSGIFYVSLILLQAEPHVQYQLIFFASPAKFPIYNNPSMIFVVETSIEIYSM